MVGRAIALGGRMPEEGPKSRIDPSKLPRHIAVIMDGNGRWARKHGLPRIAGHTEGISSVRAVVTECRELGVGHLTLYAFSHENFQRPEDEVTALMALLREYLIAEKQELLDNEIRLSAFGDTSALPEPTQDALNDVMQATLKMQRMRLNLALNYGGRQEMLRAVAKVAKEYASGSLDIDGLTEDDFRLRLYSFDQPDPDLLIRTSGEERVSNFLLWQIAYTELYFTDVLWPDFREEHLREAIIAYQGRVRKFGRVVE